MHFFRDNCIKSLNRYIYRLAHNNSVTDARTGLEALGWMREVGTMEIIHGSMKHPIDTKAMRILAETAVKYELVVTPQDASSCADVAKARGIDIAHVVKCMVAEDDRDGVHIMLVPGDRKVRLKKVRKIADVPSIEFMQPEKLSGMYGVVVGAISPIHFLDVPTVRFYMDNTVFSAVAVDVSSGDPRAGILIAPHELGEMLRAERCDIASEPCRELRRQ